MSIEADLDGVHDAGQQACALAHRLRAARSAWDGATRQGQWACGLPMLQAAFRTLQDTWFTEIGAHATVLEQLCAALPDSARIYQHTDEAAAGASEVADGGQ